MLQAEAGDGAETETAALERLLADRKARLDPQLESALNQWPQDRQDFSGDEYVVTVRDREIRNQLKRKTLSGTAIPGLPCRNSTIRENLPDG